MRVKVLVLGRSSKEVTLDDGGTVEAALVAAGAPKNAEYARHLNGHQCLDSDICHEGDIVCCIPNIKGGGD